MASTSYPPVYLILTSILVICKLWQASADLIDMEMLTFDGGFFVMGSNDKNSKTGEYPERRKEVLPFRIDKYPVQMRHYRSFMEHRRQRTRAEQLGWSYVFEDLVTEQGRINASRTLPDQPWLLAVKKANWLVPEGPGSNITGRDFIPVVHVSYQDAQYYCKWANKRLPTEAEWEFSARAGLKGSEYPWGKEMLPNRMNFWKGRFPDENLLWKHRKGLTVVNQFPAQNHVGMYDLLGNVWEWTSTPAIKHEDEKKMTTTNAKIAKGGSYLELAGPGITTGYQLRISQRKAIDPRFTAHHVGFRCARDAKHGKAGTAAKSKLPPPPRPSVKPKPRKKARTLDNPSPKRRGAKKIRKRKPDGRAGEWQPNHRGHTPNRPSRNMAGITFILLKWMLCISFCIITFTTASIKLKPAANLERIKALDDPYASMREIQGGKFKLGVNDPRSKTGEYPPREVKVRDFYIDLYPVTVSQFRKFKQNKTKFRTTAEIRGWSYIFEDALTPEVREVSERPFLDQPYMLKVANATWNRPEGPGSTTKNRMNYPLVHVTFHDAHTYCQWAGKRLPTENEWEYAARGGLKEQNYPWGDRFKKRRMNYWQGKFPDFNRVWDEWEFLSPVDAFPAQNEYGMFDLMGNVWEWTTTEFYQRGVNRHEQPKRYVLKGGSYLDSRESDYGSGNFVVRSSTRRGLEPDYSAHHVGFRCAVTSPHIPAAGSKVNKTKDRPRRVHKVHEMHDQTGARQMLLKRKAEQAQKKRSTTRTVVRVLKDEL
ncbi:uncharacterized protein LOC135475753 [Liolophura sinensis]|uniref:uncharacterized protein LOC135475753 n=1 Tax=Liolophura sinensis TaxID=3198878 RepID=UPI0031583A67